VSIFLYNFNVIKTNKVYIVVIDTCPPLYWYLGVYPPP